MQSIIDGQATHVRMLISRAKPNIDDATQALELLGQGDAPFNEDQKKTLRASLTTKISSVEGELVDKDGSKSQSNLYVYKYLTANTRGALCDKNKSDEDRCAVMVEAMRNIGFVYADVKTRKLITATLIEAVGGNKDADATKAIYDLFYKLYVEARKNLQVPSTLKNFPHDPAKVRLLYPDDYGAEDGPSPCRLDVSELMAVSR